MNLLARILQIIAAVDQILVDPTIPRAIADTIATIKKDLHILKDHPVVLSDAAKGDHNAN